MSANNDYTQKFGEYSEKTLYRSLDEEDRKAVREIATGYRMTFQDITKLSTTARDLSMWQEDSIHRIWTELEASVSGNLTGPQKKKKLFSALEQRISEMRRTPTRYPTEGLRVPDRTPLKLVSRTTEKEIFGRCPVASKKTLCCNLRTIDAVENCLYGCSYCTIQTFYDGQALQDDQLREKLAHIKLNPDRYYHITSGQSSDSLAWGDHDGMLGDLCDFARRFPNILLEFKTKSANVTALLRRSVPENVVCSWSLNTDTIITNEEHYTASLDQRLAAARKVADSGTKVAFHFHPIVHYSGWREEYPILARRVQKMFHPDEVLFISFGSVTFIKPVLKRIRERAEKTRIHQMELIPDPHGKLSNSESVKRALFGVMVQAFRPWHDQVFMYLCMERAEIWDEIFGRRYASNAEFEQDFGQKVMAKIHTG